MAASPDLAGSEGAPIDALSRRRFGRRLLGISGLAVLFSRTAPAEAAPTSDPWKLGGNTGVTSDGTNFLGTKNAAPLIFKTAATSGAPVERMRIQKNGRVGINVTAPTADLHVKARTLTAMLGVTSSTAEGATGVHGQIAAQTPGSDSAGVRGVNLSSDPAGAGVHGSHAGAGEGVFGKSHAGRGVVGRGGYAGVECVGGIYGLDATGGNTGVRGTSEAFGVVGSGGNTGIYGITGTGTGAYGVAMDAGGVGVQGISNADSTTSSGVVGLGQGLNNNGVFGEANNGEVAYAIFGASTSGYAGYFSGKVNVFGTLTKSAGSFKIDHPLAPDTKYLSHSFVESPDMMNVYNGIATLDAAGKATVRMPDWFQALNRDFRYQLSAINAPGPNLFVAGEVERNRFKIAGGSAGAKVSWQVTGIRQDAFANANRIPVEEDKPAEAKGTYLHPEAHGKPASTGINAERIKNARGANVQQAPPGIAPQRPARNSGS